MQRSEFMQGAVITGTGLYTALAEEQTESPESWVPTPWVVVVSGAGLCPVLTEDLHLRPVC